MGDGNVTDEEAAAQMNAQWAANADARLALAVKALRDKALPDGAARIVALSLLADGPYTAADVSRTRELAVEHGWIVAERASVEAGA